MEHRTVDKSITMDYSTRYLTFSFDNVFVNSRLIEGEFPPYDRVIPQHTATSTYVNREEFKNTVDFIALMSKETEYNTVKLSFVNGRVGISSNSNDGEVAAKSLPVDMQGEDVDIAFNVDYLLDVLKVVESFKVNIQLNDRLSPALFKDNDFAGYTYVVTPVRAE